MKRRPPWKRIWHIVAATGIFGLITGSVWEVATTEARLFNWITALFRGFLSIMVPLWAVLAAALAAFLVLVAIAYFGKASWAGFTSVGYCNWTFRWEYSNRWNYSSAVCNLRPICKPCDCDLSERRDLWGKGFLYCPRCGDKFELLDENALIDAHKTIISILRNWEKKGVAG